MWILNTLSQSGFPQANERGECATAVSTSCHTVLCVVLCVLYWQVPTCTTAFNSTIIIISGVDADMDSEVWSQHLHDAYQAVDPTSVGGATIFRWSSVSHSTLHACVTPRVLVLQILGQQSQSHDAVLAIMKGAMTLIANEETITADKLMPAIRAVSLFIHYVHVQVT